MVGRLLKFQITHVVSATMMVAGCMAPAKDQSAAKGPCPADNAGLTLPAGFCATVVADTVGGARHLVVRPNGDIFVALEDSSVGVVALRDANGDGVAEQRVKFGPGRGSGLAFRGDDLYLGVNDAILRFKIPAGSLQPSGPPDTIAQDLPADRSHRAKSIAFGKDGGLYVNVGSPTNSCQVKDRSLTSPGTDPCPDLEQRAGIWRFDADKLHQKHADGRRFATGMRNTVALGFRAADSSLYGVLHGRDQLHENWPKLFTEAQNAEKPSEILVRIEDGANFGWPYCYHDLEQNKTVLAPEYGGDGKKVGRCDKVTPPLKGYPGHWAPDGILFYSGTQFPNRYVNGAFIAFHGSWNRAPLPQAGFDVVFQPFDGATGPQGEHEVFADGFGGPNVASGQAIHRPVGLAQGPDGSLYVSDDQAGRIYRIRFVGASK